MLSNTTNLPFLKSILARKPSHSLQIKTKSTRKTFYFRFPVTVQSKMSKNSKKKKNRNLTENQSGKLLVEN